MELDHIVPRADGGPDDIENAIPVCFECHAEIHSYNDRHPRGRKFRSDELLLHRAQWLAFCDARPDALSTSSSKTDVGPLQALIDELEYNSVLMAEHKSSLRLGPRLLDDQFRRAMQEGGISLLSEPLKDALLSAFAKIHYTNQLIERAVYGEKRAWQSTVAEIRNLEPELSKFIEIAKNQLLSFLAREDTR